MSFPAHVWNQLKGITAGELMSALEKDGWTVDAKHGSIHIYISPSGGRVSVHFHPHKTFGPGLLKGMLKDIGCNEGELRRLKLIK